MTMTVRARSVSLAIMPLFGGARRDGVGMGHGYVDLGDRVIAITRPGAPRMPNGIECEVDVARGELCGIRGGALAVRDVLVVPGPIWDPVPEPRVILHPSSRFVPDPLVLAGRGDGLTPAGDDLLAGYAAGLVLFQGRQSEAHALAETAAIRTTALSATLLRHAARGEVPEPVHALLEEGDPCPLLAFGHTSGRCLMFGLALACALGAR